MSFKRDARPADGRPARLAQRRASAQARERLAQGFAPERAGDFRALLAGGASDIIRSEFDAFAYAVVRMPATYAAVRAALAYANEITPDLQPMSVLDVGAGSGTASWAGLDAWQSAERTTLIDNNPRLLDLARQLHASGR